MTQQPTSNPVPAIARGPGSLIAGATYPLRALWLFLKTPRLRRYVLIPMLINVVVGITLYASLLFAGFEAIDAIIASVPTWTAHAPHWAVHLPDWQLALPGWVPRLPTWHFSLPAWKISLPHWQISLPHWIPSLPSWQPSLPNWVAELPSWAAMVLVWLLRLLLTILLFLVTGIIFLQFGVLLGAPWYGKLSEELEKLQTGQMTLIEVGTTQEIGRAVLYELKKLVLTIAIGLPLFLLNFFPGIGTAIASIGGIALASTIVCLDFLDAAVERRRPRFRQKLSILWRSLPASATFGLVCFGLVSIPLVNLLAVPVCVAAGTLFFCDRVLPWFQVNDRGV
jgi:CysZ protein